jgi:hypothetical protein
MTDDLLPAPSPDDELVSAVLDGEATDAERARITAEPALQARLVELGAARDALAVPVKIDDSTREAGLAAALAAASEPGGILAGEPGAKTSSGHQVASEPATGTNATGSEVVDLAARRRTRLTVAAAAVAAVVVLAVAVPLAVGRGSDEKFTATGAAVDDAAAPRSTVVGSGGAASRAQVAEKSADDAGPPAPGAAPGPAPSTTASALPLATIPPDSPAVVAASYLGDDLGTVESPDEVRDRVEDRFNATRQDVHEGEGGEPLAQDGDEDHGAAAVAPTGTYLPPEAQREIVLRLQACDPAIRASEAGLGVTVFTAGLVYRGAPALVFLYDGAPTAANRLVTVERATCAVLDRQPAPF